MEEIILKDLQTKLDEINNLIDDNEGEEACIEFFNLIKELEEDNYSNLANLYYDFAILLFNNYFYEDCIKTFFKAYELNYNKSEIKTFIFEHFITPNFPEFKSTYENNIKNYYNKNDYVEDIAYEDIAYEDLPLEFIPVSDSKYYIFDLQNDVFNQFVDFSIENITPTADYDEFSDILILNDYNLSNIELFLDNKDNRIIYHLSSNSAKIISFLKLPNINKNFIKNLFIFPSVDLFKTYFRNNTYKYLPTNVLSTSDKIDFENDINKFLQAEHEFRLIPEGRNNTNILLSICIISYNNGDRALKTLTKLLNLKYDAEIEFLIINNFSDKTLDSYKEIHSLTDARISYFELPQHIEQGLALCKGLELAKGNFTLILNSGDFINSEVLSDYMNLLKNNPNLGIVRTGTSSAYSNLENLYINNGENAFLNFFLNNNSINGIIYNKKIIDSFPLIELLSNSIKGKNEFSLVYPNMYLDAFLLLKGDFYAYPKVLCIENPSIHSNEIENINNINLQLGYSSYKSRINQHYGVINMLNELKLSQNALLNAYVNLCWKTNFLVSLVNEKYNSNGYDLNAIYDDLYDCCINGIQQLEVDFSEEEKLLLKNSIKNINDQFRK